MNVITTKPPVWFRAVAVLAVLWNLIGVWSYLGHVGTVPPMQEMTPEQQVLMATIPTWVTGAFALAVFTGLIGSLGLLLSKAWARLVLIVSLVCIVVQMGWVLFVSEARAVEGSQAFVMPILITAIALLLVWAASTGVKRGWLT
ncbi:MAG: hypothetical protein ACT4N8_07030 [Sphingosinicella sp.]|uniref:hypothetical protein n=1 Tax=Sphingosinicella sp. TaxID=1917971 RepID=UPI004037DB0A